MARIRLCHCEKLRQQAEATKPARTTFSRAGNLANNNPETNLIISEIAKFIPSDSEGPAFLSVARNDSTAITHHPNRSLLVRPINLRSGPFYSLYNP